MRVTAPWSRSASGSARATGGRHLGARRQARQPAGLFLVTRRCSANPGGRIACAASAACRLRNAEVRGKMQRGWQAVQEKTHVQNSCRFCGVRAALDACASRAGQFGRAARGRPTGERFGHDGRQFTAVACAAGRRRRAPGLASGSLASGGLGPRLGRAARGGLGVRLGRASRGGLGPRLGLGAAIRGLGLSIRLPGVAQFGGCRAPRPGLGSRLGRRLGRRLGGGLGPGLGAPRVVVSAAQTPQTARRQAGCLQRTVSPALPGRPRNAPLPRFRSPRAMALSPLAKPC
jgi:hypothetical protein